MVRIRLGPWVFKLIRGMSEVRSVERGMGDLTRSLPAVGGDAKGEEKRDDV